MLIELFLFLFSEGWLEVQWDHGGVNSYRMGAEGKYDLEMTGEDPAIPPPPSLSTKEGQDYEIPDERDCTSPEEVVVIQ